MRGWLLVVAAASGCITPEVVDCGDGIVCPANTVCTTIQAAGIANGERLCPTHAELDACAGLDAYAACGTDHACYATSAGLVCLPSGCGNRLVDPQLGEVCDDGNSIVGDGCSYNCRSDETCGNGFLDPVKLDSGGNPIANETCDDANKIGRDGCSSACGLETPRWDQITFELPPALQDAAMVYDAIRDRVVLFGGARSGATGAVVFSNATWEWDGIAWVQVSPSLGPPGRASTAMAYAVRACARSCSAAKMVSRAATCGRGTARPGRR